MVTFHTFWVSTQTADHGAPDTRPPLIYSATLTDMNLMYHVGDRNKKRYGLCSRQPQLVGDMVIRHMGKFFARDGAGGWVRGSPEKMTCIPVSLLLVVP